MSCLRIVQAREVVNSELLTNVVQAEVFSAKGLQCPTDQVVKTAKAYCQVLFYLCGTIRVVLSSGICAHFLTDEI